MIGSLTLDDTSSGTLYYHFTCVHNVGATQKDAAFIYIDESIAGATFTLKKSWYLSGGAYTLQCLSTLWSYPTAYFMVHASDSFDYFGSINTGTATTSIANVKKLYQDAALGTTLFTNAAVIV